MQSLKERKYKDAMPNDTICIIRHLLSDMGITPIETEWYHSVNDFYSVRITIDGTNIGVNGKGTTHEYALASAYAELMERIQNMTQYRLTIDMSPEAHRYKGFYYNPDEQGKSIYEIIYSEDEWFKAQRKMIAPETDIYQLLKKWQQISYEQIPYDFITIPYMNLNTKKLSYIPIKMVSKMYMSNGMCSGNTREEAAVQGICEVLERYINKKILNEKITPPSFPETYLKKYPRIYSMIKTIEGQGDKKVIVKDCSLGEGYPVTAVIYIDKKEGAYFVKFGSHPIFELSVERTLTELLQGQNISRMVGLTPFDCNNNRVNQRDNVLGVLINGVGSYSRDFFQENSSYSWRPFNWAEHQRNSDLLKSLVEFMEEKGFHTYLREVSFLRYPSLHVIIPGISEVESIDDEKALDQYIEYTKTKRVLRRYCELPKEDRKEFLSLVEKGAYFFSDISKLMQLKGRRKLPRYLSDMGLFVTVAYCELNMYKKAYDCFLRWFTYASGKKDVLNNRLYYRCIMNFLYLKSQEKEYEYIHELLETFYPIEITERVLKEFDKYNTLSNDLMQCWNCEGCVYQEGCTYPEEEKIYKMLKRRYASNPIDQEDLKNII